MELRDFSDNELALFVFKTLAIRFGIETVGYSRAINKEIFFRVMKEDFVCDRSGNVMSRVFVRKNSPPARRDTVASKFLTDFLSGRIRDEFTKIDVVEDEFDSDLDKWSDL